MTAAGSVLGQFVAVKITVAWSHLWVPVALVKGSFVTTHGMFPNCLPHAPGIKLTWPELRDHLCALQLHPCSWVAGRLQFVWWGLSLGWPVSGQTSHRGRGRDNPFWRSPLAQQFTHREEKYPVVIAINDWWLAQGQSSVPFAVLNTVAGLFCQLYCSGNNSHYFCGLSFSPVFYLHTLDCG